eukprot:CAMPEP_0198118118 /NCGR_PEP_ID=MMETSP1442-20131203/20428_1 /TAXON_ID= /ORGANISM="Craspedostauros australis, Strain CCMP3328" /LENGTH=59 /DNA_ID=CAMNT_0043776317 /DNA_START=285 /DNA_END=461 /DNA_ORIENTATION=+
MEMLGVGNAQSAHAEAVLRLGKVQLEVTSSAIRFVAADFASIEVIETVQFEQPVRHRLA